MRKIFTKSNFFRVVGVLFLLVSVEMVILIYKMFTDSANLKGFEILIMAAYIGVSFLIRAIDLIITGNSKTVEISFNKKA